jgi:hypothetical protein
VSRLTEEKEWVTARRSNGNGGNNCVEVAQLDTVIAVRDSKDRSGPQLNFGPSQWAEFVTGVKDGQFDL